MCFVTAADGSGGHGPCSGGSDPEPTGLRVIAIDGPAGAGKSTVARELAMNLGLDYLDTGAMYRAVAYAVLRAGGDPDDGAFTASVARDLRLEVSAGTVLVDGSDASIEIRSPAVNSAVSIVAANPRVRAEMVSRQREWVRQRGGGVLEGRDIGSVVFPDAELKVYLTAEPAVRARRRAAETGDVDQTVVAADLERRDTIDTTRDSDPLVLAADAELVDTSETTVSEVVANLISLLRKRATQNEATENEATSNEATENEATSKAGVETRGIETRIETRGTEAP